MLKIFKPFRYWLELYRELRIFYIFRKVALEHEEMLERDHELRVDWLGRIYGVINIPEEVAGAAQQIQEAYVLQAITNYGKVMLKIGLADVMYPEIERIPGAAAYLVILWPEYTALNIWSIIGNLIRTTFILSLFYLLVRLSVKYFEPIMGWFAHITTLLKSIL